MWVLLSFSIEARADTDIKLCGDSHLNVLKQLEESLDQSFSSKGKLAEPFREARSACARFVFEKSKEAEAQAEVKLEQWNQRAADLCEPFFEADGKSELFSKESDEKCIGAVFRAQISSVKSMVKGLKPICELMQDTREMDTEGACLEMKSARAEKTRL